MNGSVGAQSSVRDVRGIAQGLFELTKPRVTRMVLVTTLAGAIIAPGRPSLAALAIALVATAAVVAGANTLNMYLERDVDLLMSRTRARPIPSGRLSPETALWFGVALGISGITALTFWVNAASALLCAIAFLSYVLVYTPMKRVTPFALHVGAVPGAMPPLIGWVAMTGKLSPAALSLFAILLIWQIPHFLAIAIFREREYAAAGLAVYPAVKGIPAAKRAVLGYSILLFAVSLAPLAFGLGGVVYGVLAVLFGLAQIGVAIYGLRVDGVERWARGLFFATLPYLVILFGCLAFTAP
jgi:protoheme IX farnesyltransferase